MARAWRSYSPICPQGVFGLLLDRRAAGHVSSMCAAASVADTRPTRVYLRETISDFVCLVECIDERVRECGPERVSRVVYKECGFGMS